MKTITGERSKAYAEELDSIERLITERIAIGLALERDGELAIALSSTVRGLGGECRDVVVIDTTGPVIFMDGATIVGCATFFPASLTLPKDTLVSMGDQKRERLWASIKRSNAFIDAQVLVNSLIRRSEAVDREMFERIYKWRHLFAASSYKWVTVASMMIDTSRKGYKQAVLKREMRQRYVLREYQNLVRAMGALISLACTGPDTAWLSEMAMSFPWHTWTPSLVLSRERSMLSAVQAGSAASQFGPEVISRYLERIGGKESPLVIYDAVLGLTAIATRHRTHIDEILERMSRALTARQAYAHDETRVMEALNFSAELALRTPEVAIRQVDAWCSTRAHVTPSMPLSEDDVRTSFIQRVTQDDVDGAVVVDGCFPAILALPLFDPSRPERFYLRSLERREIDWRNAASNARQALMRSGTPRIECGLSSPSRLH
ncbi:hypothetical protein [Paraburkholderia aspalathi]|uniref:Uncharacterized protein n=1 Tax=Paraburkholderia aspalathi TaxID=1324617 RepID=A0A1I7EPQ8_9BURK|nr:hypothetical protein [Paraburkholderia aspalathi]SFU25902.1 hypothetical protein SAMN05192563_104337 [Paraburkholderia aspalathi]